MDSNGLTVGNGGPVAPVPRLHGVAPHRTWRGTGRRPPAALAGSVGAEWPYPPSVSGGTVPTGRLNLPKTGFAHGTIGGLTLPVHTAQFLPFLDQHRPDPLQHSHLYPAPEFGPSLQKVITVDPPDRFR